MYPGQQRQQPYRIKYFSIDVEAVASGYDHNSRSVAQISLVDQNEQVHLNMYIKQSLPVVSYLTALTGLTRATLDAYGISLEHALVNLRANLPRDAILVGQNIRKDVEWLGLKEGIDFESLMDLAGMYRCWNAQYKSWSLFGQDHVARVLLGWEAEQGVGSHDAVRDAIKSMRLFNYYNQMQVNPGTWEQAQQALLGAPQEPSFARLNPSYDGVCMGNRKTCTCGAAFFS